MSNGDVSWIATYIWGIADDVLRDLYVRGKYRDVILPMTVLRRLDAVLEPTKGNVLRRLPDADEQQAILDWIDESAGPLDKTVRDAEREISLLQEYRTRLIADVVTGKLDVHEAAARLPDEVDEPERFSDAGDLPVDDEVADDADLDAALEEVEA